MLSDTVANFNPFANNRLSRIELNELEFKIQFLLLTWEDYIRDYAHILYIYQPHFPVEQ